MKTNGAEARLTRSKGRTTHTYTNVRTQIYTRTHIRTQMWKTRRPIQLIFLRVGISRSWGMCNKIYFSHATMPGDADNSTFLINVYKPRAKINSTIRVCRFHPIFTLKKQNRRVGFAFKKILRVIFFNANPTLRFCVFSVKIG